ncbi:hypothetical protein ALC60_08411, partial [Trachymyrmex zeteki]
HAQIPIPTADRCFSGSSSHSGTVLGNVRVAFEDDRREGDSSDSVIAFGVCLESHESGYTRRERSWSERKLLGSARSREEEHLSDATSRETWKRRDGTRRSFCSYHALRTDITSDTSKFHRCNM